MNMTYDFAVLEALRGRIVSNLWIGKDPCIEIIYLQFDVKIFVSLDIISRPGIRNDGRHHAINGGDVAHGYDMSGLLP